MNNELSTKNKFGLLPKLRKETPPIRLQGDNAANENHDILEGEGKVKTKLMSMWYNMKYGWNVKLKTNFSKDSPVWLLGRCYHKKVEVNEEQSVEKNDSYGEEEGIEGFKSDFVSRIWLTYRREFPILDGSNFTTDCGWGCMLRSGQMLLAQALVCHFLGRGWRWDPEQKPRGEKQYKDSVNHRKIIKWLGDTPNMSPFSIHTLVSLGEASGKKAGDWYGPGSVAHLIKKALDLAASNSTDFTKLTAYVAQDCAVYIQDVIDQCEIVTDEGTDWKAVIILVPVRLGVEKLNSVYATCLTDLLTFENCIGIIGGRPKHSLYFVGYQDDKLIHLDPHYCQEMVNVWDPGFPLASFHCKSPRKMNLSKLDPSCCIGFYCKTRDDFDNYIKNIQQHLIPPHEKAEYPMFVFCDGRSRDALNVRQFSIPDDSLKLEDTDDELECEEFEII